MEWAVLVALASSALFATGSALQHRAAGAAPSSSKLGMLAALVARPGWLIGVGLSAAAFVLHATALHLGDLTVVQPVILSGIVFTVVVRAGLAHRLPSRRDVAWSLVTWGGLCLFVAALHPGPTQRPVALRAEVMTGVGALAVGSLVVMATCLARGRRRGMLLGAAAGSLFGLVAGLVKLTLTEVSSASALLTRWSLWALLVLGVWAVLLNQRAYQAARMTMTVPILNLCQLIVGLTFGWVVFAERPGTSPVLLVMETVGLLAMCLGVVELARGVTEVPSAAQVNGSHDDQDEHPAARRS